MYCNEFRRGDTFWFSGSAALYDQSGQKVDMSNVVAQSQIRTSSGVLIADLSATVSDDAANIRYYGDTSAWPLGKAQIDVKLTLPDSTVVGTNKQWIEIVERVTQ